MSEFSYPEEFVTAIQNTFSGQQGLEYDIRQAAQQNKHDLGALLSKYENKIECDFTVKKEERVAFECFLTDIIRALNYYDFDSLDDVTAEVIQRQKMKIMLLRSALQQKRIVRDLYKWWEFLYDEQQRQYQRVPTSPKR